MSQIKKVKEQKVAAIFNSDLNYKKNSYKYDEYLEAFAVGGCGILSSWDEEQDTTTPLVIRGVGTTSRKALQHCWKNDRTFYTIDTGYFGNRTTKVWHRVTKNALQHLGPIVPRNGDRLKKIGYTFQKFRPGRKILICPPSDKVMRLWEQPSPEEWVEQVVTELGKYTDRPIEIRLKPIRSDRVTTNTMQGALNNDVHCLITYNSIAATEALMYGKPAIALGPNAAQVLCNTTLSEVEDLYIPSKHEMEAFMRHLSYCQFTREELINGYAWAVVNGDEV